MDKSIIEQRDKLNVLWHDFINHTKYQNIEDKYPELNKLDENEISIVRIISENEEVIIKDIIDILKVPKSTLTSIIDRLEKKNIISREISKKDRRSYKLQLTKKGMKIKKQHDDFENEFFLMIISLLDTYQEREELLNLMKKIIKNMSKIDINKK